ncbi:hypothetical protein MBRU_05890 [Mycolicibacterium brumae DSM 44177]|nr:hypothetical protein MBRU_05890 [Mycolicibacterium brumae DSM 44177]
MGRMTEDLGLTERAANIAVVDLFLNSLRDKDTETAAKLVDDNIVYENVGFSRLRGAQKVLKVFDLAQRPSFGFDVVTHRSAADGPVVLNERTDLLRFGRFQTTFWVCGVFEVHDGKITLWRDYFDNVNFLKGAARGLAGTVFPALRPSL